VTLVVGDCTLVEMPRRGLGKMDEEDEMQRRKREKEVTKNEERS
jgi:hypothetical protein